MVRVVAPTEVFVPDPLRLPDVEGAFGVVVAGFLGFWVIELERVVVTEPCSPCCHELFQAFDFSFIFGIVGEVIRFVGVGLDVEQESMVDLRVDVQFPAAVVDRALVVLEREKDGISHGLGFSLPKGGEVFGVDAFGCFNIRHGVDGGVKIVYVGE